MNVDASPGSDAGDAPDAEEDAAADAPIDAGPPDYTGARPSTSTVIDGVRRDIFLVPSAASPTNPTTGEATPRELDATQVLRYRRDVEPPAPVRAIIVAMPGFLGGGGSFHGLAKSIVTRGVGGDAVEVWAIDRRSNLLEDLRGMDTAEVLRDPEIAEQYYAGRATIDGEAFGDYLAQRDVGYMSEWGLATHVADLRSVLALVPEEHRRARVFLLGHSLGASFVESYAAWRFEDGARGFEELAGVIFLDGIAASEPIDETQYRDGFMNGFASSPGLTALRSGPQGRYTQLPLLGADVYEIAEVLSLRAIESPTAVIEDPRRARVFSILTGLRINEVPRVTNRAALGLGFDDQIAPLGFVRLRLGTIVGPTETYMSAFGDETLIRPSDPDATYDWVDAIEADDITPIAELAEAVTHGRTNLFEWYFPARLALDLAAAAGSAIAEDGYQASEGLRAFDGRLNDAPALCIAAALVADAALCDGLRDRLAPTIGADRPAAGLARSDLRAFRTVDATDVMHLDVVVSAQDVNPAPAAVVEFVTEHAAAGTVGIGAF